MFNTVSTANTACLGADAQHLSPPTQERFACKPQRCFVAYGIDTNCSFASVLSSSKHSMAPSSLTREGGIPYKAQLGGLVEFKGGE